MLVSSFHDNVPFPYPLKTRGFLTFWGVYKKYWQVRITHQPINMINPIHSYSNSFKTFYHCKKTKLHLEFYQRPKMELFAKIVTRTYFYKKLHLRCLSVFWICLCKSSTIISNEIISCVVVGIELRCYSVKRILPNFCKMFYEILKPFINIILSGQPKSV